MKQEFKMKGIDMKTVCSVIFLSFLFIPLLVTSVNGSSDDWLEYGKDTSGDVFSYDRNTIQYIRKDVVQAWSKKVYSDKGREELGQMKIKNERWTADYDKLSHDVILYEIDCKKQRSQVVSFTYYDTDSIVFKSYSYEKPEWSDITPDSIMDDLRKIVCK